LKDNYFEEALKMRNLLEEFSQDHGKFKPSILGVREHVFTGRCYSVHFGCVFSWVHFICKIPVKITFFFLV
jgi:hypothetical protein